MSEKTMAMRSASRHFDTRRMRGQEVEARRDERSKTFALGKGLYQTVIYPERVHYRDQKGDWQAIDSRLKPAKGEQALETTSGPLRTRLALRADAEHLVTIRDERGYTLGWRLEGASGVPCVQKKPMPRGDNEDENRANADNSASTVQYTGILPHTDLICELHGDRLKESLVLESPDAPAQYRFTLDIQGLAWEETAGGGLRLWDAARPEEDVFRLPPPYMSDATGAVGMVHAAYQAQGDNLCMTMTPDAAFLSEAMFPVVVDPTVQSAQTTANILDTYLSETSAAVNYGTAQTLRVGKHAAYGQCKALVKIASLPTLTSAYTVAKAWMALAVLPTTGYTADAYLYAHEALADWGQTTATWNNQPSHDAKHLDYALVKKGEAEAKSVQLDITNLVRKWYASSADNFGVVLDSHEDQAIELCAAENTTYTATARPVIYVNYVSNAGLEGYLAYESFGAGRAGTAHVALHSGNLAATRGLTAMSGNRLPVSLGLTWNACHMDTDSFGVGKGWRLNWNQNLRREQPATGDYTYVLTDGDGTEHEFRKHEKTAEEQADTGFVDYYEDRSGLSLKLYEGASEAEVVSKDHGKLVFDKPTTVYTTTMNSDTVKMVKRALDAQGNTASFIHDTSFHLTQATDGAGRVTTLAYTASDVRITVPGYAQQVVLSLDASRRLTAVTDLDGAYSEYVYGAEPATPNPAAPNRLRLLRNMVDGARLNPLYDARGRVAQMTAYADETVDNGSGGTTSVRTDGNDRSYTYFDCVTQVRDLTVENGKVLTYQFNDYGNVVAVHDELGFAAFAKYGMGKPNTPEAVSKLQRLVVNLLEMHHFTEDGGWKSGVIGTDGIARESDVTLTGLKPLCLECPAPKWLSQGETAYAEYLKACAAGEHTFSVYVQSKGDVLAWAELAWQDSSGQWHTVQSERVRRVGSPLRLTCTATLPQAATVRCRVLAGDGTGAAWFDRAQLEQGALASRHNMLQNANFTALPTDEWPEGWTFAENEGDTAGEARATVATAAESVNKPKSLSANCLRLQSAPSRKTEVYQELDIRGEQADNYVVGGWARAWAAPSGDKRTFRLRVQFQKKNGVWADGGTANWNEEWVDWQYACGAAVAPADYRKVRVYIDYDENLNEAQIGAVSLTKEYYGQNFAYDEKNNVTAVSTLLGQKDKAEYDKFDNLTTYVQPGREASDKYTFFYGDTDAEKKRHLPLRSETPLGLVAETKYDAYGNATESTARDKADGSFIRTGTAYTANGNYAAGATDALGNATLVSIDPSKGLTLSATDAAGQQVSYQYDAAGRVTGTEAVVSAGSKTYLNAYTYEKDRLKTVSHNTTASPTDNVTYTFETDALGNQTVVKVGNQVLSTNAYTATGDKLLTSVTYGNGGKVSYAYDSFKRTTGIGYDEATAPRFTYEYGANGAVGRVKDEALGREARMAYDLVERPVEAELYENGALKYRLTQEYDRFEQPSVLHERVEEPDDTRSEYTISATYDKESRPTAITCESARMTALGVPDVQSKRKLAYRYDGLGRIVRRDFHANGDANAETATPLFQTEYGYEVGGYGANSTTARVQSIVQAGQKREYWYDKLGNITRECWQGNAAAGGDIAFESDPITSPDGDTLTLDAAALDARYNTTYAYDALGQLLRANDERAGATWTYAYDLGGNILEKKRYAYTTAADLSALTPAQTVPYAYGDAGWKDKLTSFDGKAITYDAIGNPLAYDGWAYAWKAGRMLHSMARSGENPVNAQFTYDHTGLRVKKTVNGVDTLYTLNGKKITHIRKGANGATGTDAVQMHFFYDAQGRPMLVRYMDVDYAYLHSLQGDITGLVDMTGTTVVEYRYDAWGKPISTTGSMAGTLGKDNPFRYRGYVWDEETGLYYLRSRYYDPNWGRFVNADALIAKGHPLLQHNAYVYCKNAVIIAADADGQDAIIVTSDTSVTHMSALFQDESGSWFFLYWGASKEGSSSSANGNMSSNASAGSSATQGNGYFEYRRLDNFPITSAQSDEDILRALNDSKVPGGVYHRMIYLEGDFTPSHEASMVMAKEQSKLTYNLLTNNCAHMAIRLLMESRATVAALQLTEPLQSIMILIIPIQMHKMLDYVIFDMKPPTRKVNTSRNANIRPLYA